MCNIRITAVELVVASFIVLFQEMTLIRWIASQVRVTTYFPNVILLNAFLGLGLAVSGRAKGLCHRCEVNKN